MSEHYVVVLNPPSQYADERNLRARQRFWEHQEPVFDIVGWVLDLAGLSPGMRVLDAGCGNGLYLRGLAARGVLAAGCDLSMGMLRSAGHPAVVNADVSALPGRDGAFDVVLAIHMLYCAASSSRPSARQRPAGRCARRRMRSPPRTPRRNSPRRSGPLPACVPTGSRPS